MTENNLTEMEKGSAPLSEEQRKQLKGQMSSARAVYILYLIGLVIGLTAFIGLVLAYVKRSPDNPDWLNDHYSFQIQTFWYGVLYFIVGILLSAILIGWLVIVYWLVWIVIRCVKGMSALESEKSIKGGLFTFGNID